MAEVKITCPNCFNDKQCFEETAMDFKSYICFNCGFTSNSSYTNESEALKLAQEKSTQLMKDVSMYDYDRKIHWFPSVLNMGKFGVIFPEGIKNNCSLKRSARKTQSFPRKSLIQGHLTLEGPMSEINFWRNSI